MDALERELSSKADNDGVDDQSNTGILMRELADVKARFNKLGVTAKEPSRGKLVDTVLHREAFRSEGLENPTASGVTKTIEQFSTQDEDSDSASLDMVKFTADIDRRLGTLEKIIGSSSTALDEVHTRSDRRAYYV